MESPSRILTKFKYVDAKRADCLERGSNVCLKLVRNAFGHRIYTAGSSEFEKKTSRCFFRSISFLFSVVLFPLTLLGIVMVLSSKTHRNCYKTALKVKEKALGVVPKEKPPQKTEKPHSPKTEHKNDAAVTVPVAPPVPVVTPIQPIQEPPKASVEPVQKEQERAPEKQEEPTTPSQTVTAAAPIVIPTPPEDSTKKEPEKEKEKENGIVVKQDSPIKPAPVPVPVKKEQPPASVNPNSAGTKFLNAVGKFRMAVGKKFEEFTSPKSQIRETALSFSLQDKTEIPATMEEMDEISKIIIQNAPTIDIAKKLSSKISTESISLLRCFLNLHIVFAGLKEPKPYLIFNSFPFVKEEENFGTGLANCCKKEQVHILVKKFSIVVSGKGSSGRFLESFKAFFQRMIEVNDKEKTAILMQTFKENLTSFSSYEPKIVEQLKKIVDSTKLSPAEKEAIKF